MSYPKKLLARAISQFAKDQRGNVAVTFAFAAIPLVVFVGASIDYSRATSTRTKLQDALDATVLMLAKEAANESSTQLQANATKYFNSLFNQSSVSATVSASYSNSNGSQVTISGAASVPTTLMKVLGFQSIPIGGSSVASWGNNRLRVALVLDNTGSMSASGKLTALQTAAQNLLTQLQSAASSNGDVYVSIIPFVKDVNLGASNYNASWIDWTDWSANNGTCTSSSHGNGNGNVNTTTTGGTQSSCGGTWTPANHNTWNGCVTDRGNSSGPASGNYDTNVVAPTTTNTATLYSAEQYSACPQAAVGLTYDWQSMSSLVNNMVANGNTNQAVGLQLGWMSLVGVGPFTAPAMTSNYTYSQIIILLTDGLNTQDRWYTAQSSIDARQQITCDNIKAAGVTLYTIQVNTSGDPTSTLLQNCATDASKFFLLTSANEIVATFQKIGTNLTQLRLSR